MEAFTVVLRKKKKYIHIYIHVYIDWAVKQVLTILVQAKIIVMSLFERKHWLHFTI